MPARPPVAIVHDYLTQRGGAERVVLELARAFPEAPIYTSVFAPERTFPAFAELDVRPMRRLQSLGVVQRDHRFGLPAYGKAFSRLQVAADAVVCSSSGWAHRVRHDGRKVVYCHNPPRWLWQPEDYLRELPWPVKAAVRAVAPSTRRRDRHAAQAANHYLANSRIVAERIKTNYGLEASVIAPPYSLDPTGPIESIPDVAPGSSSASRGLLPYKNVDVALAAIRGLPHERLVVVGQGPDEDRLRGLAPPNALVAGGLTDAQLRWAYRSCAALLAISHEDHGLTPLEAATFGRPTIALRFGGYLDTIVDGTSGTFVDRPEAALVQTAIERVLATEWSASSIQEHARAFTPELFRDAVREAVIPSGKVSRALALPRPR